MPRPRPLPTLRNPLSQPRHQMPRLRLLLTLRNPLSRPRCQMPMIERVDVYRGYQLKLKLNISVEQFLVSLENIKAPGQTFTA